MTPLIQIMATQIQSVPKKNCNVRLITSLHMEPFSPYASQPALNHARCAGKKTTRQLILDKILKNPGILVIHTIP